MVNRLGGSAKRLPTNQMLAKCMLYIFYYFILFILFRSDISCIGIIFTEIDITRYTTCSSHDLVSLVCNFIEKYRDWKYRLFYEKISIFWYIDNLTQVWIQRLNARRRGAPLRAPRRHRHSGLRHGQLYEMLWVRTYSTVWPQFYEQKIPTLYVNV